MSRLKDLLAERRKAKEQPVAVPTEVQGESDNDTPALILVPFFDLVQTDEYSEFF